MNVEFRIWLKIKLFFKAIKFTCIQIRWETYLMPNNIQIMLQELMRMNRTMNAFLAVSLDVT